MLSPEVNFSEIKEPSPSDELLSYEEKPPNPQVQEDMPPTLKEIPSKCSWHIHKNGVKGCAAWHHSACGHVDSEACTHSFPRATSVPLGAIKDQECLPALTCTDHISGLMKTKDSLLWLMHSSPSVYHCRCWWYVTAKGSVSYGALFRTVEKGYWTQCDWLSDLYWLGCCVMAPEDSVRYWSSSM